MSVCLYVCLYDRLRASGMELVAKVKTPFTFLRGKIEAKYRSNGRFILKIQIYPRGDNHLTLPRTFGAEPLS